MGTIGGIGPDPYSPYAPLCLDHARTRAYAAAPQPPAGLLARQNEATGTRPLSAEDDPDGDFVVSARGGEA
jgi:hypothetical protein